MSTTYWLFMSAFIQLCVAGIVKQDITLTEESQTDIRRIFNSYSDNNTADWMTNVYFAGGIVSDACMRCLCLFRSDCEPVGCQLIDASRYCGYFQLSVLKWIDCGKLGKDFASCSNDLQCSSMCVQKYMRRYVNPGNCPKNCEGFSRLLFGGPGGCSNPSTFKSWKALQKVPGCKGVQ